MAGSFSNTSNAAPTGNFTNIQNTNISGLDDSLNPNMFDKNQDQYMDMFDLNQDHQ